MPRPDKGSSSTYYATTKRARQDELRGGEKSALGFDDILRELAKLGHAGQTSEYYAAASETIIKCIREEDDRGRRKHHITASKSSALDKTREKRDSGKNELPQQDPRPAPKVQAESKVLSTTRRTSASSSHAEANISSPPLPPKFSVTPRTPARSAVASADVQTHLVDRALSDGTSETVAVYPSAATFPSTNALDSADFNNDAEDMDIDRNSPIKPNRWTDWFVKKPLVVSEQFSAIDLPDLPPSSRQWTCDDGLEDSDTLMPPAARLHQQLETNANIAEKINPSFSVKHETLEYLCSKIDKSALTRASHSYSLPSDSDACVRVVDVQMDDIEDIDGEPVAAEPVQAQTENSHDAVRLRLRRPRRFTQQTVDAMLSPVCDEHYTPQFADDARAVIKHRRLEEENNARRDAAKSDVSPDGVVSAIEKATDAHVDAEAGSVLIVASSPVYDVTHTVREISPLRQTTTTAFATMVDDENAKSYFTAQSCIPTVSQIHEANETAEVPVFASAVEKAVDNPVPRAYHSTPDQYLSYPLLKFFRMMLGEMVEKAKHMPLPDFYSRFSSSPNFSKLYPEKLSADNVERIIMRQCSKIVTIHRDRFADDPCWDNSAAVDTAVLYIKPNWRYDVFECKPSAEIECEIERDHTFSFRVQEQLREIFMNKSSGLTTKGLYHKWNDRIDCSSILRFNNIINMCAILRQYFTDTVTISNNVSVGEAMVRLMRDAQFPSLSIRAPPSSSSRSQGARQYTYLSFEYLKCFRNRLWEDVRYGRDMRLREIAARLHTPNKIVQYYGMLTVANIERIISRQCRSVLKLTYFHDDDENDVREYESFGADINVDDGCKHELDDLFVNFRSSAAFLSDPIPRSFMSRCQEVDDHRRRLFMNKMQKILYELLASAPKQYLELHNLFDAWHERGSRGGLAFKFGDAVQMRDVLYYCFSDIVSLFSTSAAPGFVPEIVVSLVHDAKYPAHIFANRNADAENSAANSRSSSRSTERRSRGRDDDDESFRKRVPNGSTSSREQVGGSAGNYIDDNSYWRRMLTNDERFRSDLVADLNDVFVLEQKKGHITLPLGRLYQLYNKDYDAVNRRRRQPFRNAQQMGDIIQTYLDDKFSIRINQRRGVVFIRRIMPQVVV